MHSSQPTHNRWHDGLLLSAMSDIPDLSVDGLVQVIVMIKLRVVTMEDVLHTRFTSEMGKIGPEGPRTKGTK